MRSKWNGFAVALSALLLSLPAAAFAIGQITEPIVVDNALRGQSYESTVTVVNTEKTDTDISLSADGDIKDWVKFYQKSTDENTIDSISLKAGEKKDLVARFTVPDSAANNAYKGVISVSGKPGEYTSNGKDSGSSVTQKIDREVTINVSDQEIVKFDASIIPESYDIARGDPLKIRVQYDNRSNIDIKPQISIKLQNGDNTAYNAIFPYPDNIAAVKPGSIFEIPQLEIPTSNLATGKYKVILKISEGDKFSLDKDFTFSIGAVKAASTAAATSAKVTFSGGISPLAIGGVAAFLVLIVVLFLFRNRLPFLRKNTRKEEIMNTFYDNK